MGGLAAGARMDTRGQRGKKSAIKRAVAEKALEEAGVSEADLLEAVRAEYGENEVFPPSDSVEDWLKLLDYDPENVVRVQPKSARSERPRDPAAAARVICSQTPVQCGPLRAACVAC